MAGVIWPTGPQPKGGPMFLCDKRLYQTADRRRLVEEGDPDAAFLFCALGDEIPDEDAERLGVKAFHGAVENKAMAMGEGPDQPEPEPEPEEPEPEPARRRR
jgi:hypothetical protein